MTRVVRIPSMGVRSYRRFNLRIKGVHNLVTYCLPPIGQKYFPAKKSFEMGTILDELIRPVSANGFSLLKIASTFVHQFS